MVSPEKMQELRAVVDFWKSRVDETKSELRRLLVRQSRQPESDRCGQSIMVTLVEMKTREFSDSQRGLRRAQANLGRAMELACALVPARGGQLVTPLNRSIGPSLNTPSRSDLNGAAHRHSA